jgi:hypothetical protein
VVARSAGHGDPAPGASGADRGIYPDDVHNESAGPGDRLVRIGAVLFIIGTIATLATITPLLIGTEALPTAVYLVSVLMPVGFAVAGTGLFKSARSQRRPVPETP